MKIALASDKSGYKLYLAIKEYLVSGGFEILDLGASSEEEAKPYFEVAQKVASLVSNKEVNKAVLICGTGMGMAIVSNKYKNVYAAVVEGVYSAKMCAVVNQANILTMGGWIVGPNKAVEMVEVWLNTEFAEGFPQQRKEFLQNAFNNVQEIENENFK